MILEEFNSRMRSVINNFQLSLHKKTELRNALADVVGTLSPMVPEEADFNASSEDSFLSRQRQAHRYQRV